MKHVLITTSSFDDQLVASFEAFGLHAVLNPYGRKLTEEEAGSLFEQYRPVGMIAGVEPLTRSVLGKAPFLKVISRCGIGMDSVDLAAAAALGIRVTNTPDAPTIPVAELTIGMILTLLRSLHVSDASIRQGGWERPMGALLHGKKVGIIGCGRIGSYVARLVSAFGSQAVGYDPFCATHDGMKMVSLDSLLQTADIVSLHLPYTEANHYFLSRERIAQMKQGAALINASRGGLVDEIALTEALKDGRLSGAALDCFEQEPYSGPLAQLKNVLLTGHIGSYAREGRMIMEQQAAENLLNGLRDLKAIS